MMAVGTALSTSHSTAADSILLLHVGILLSDRCDGAPTRREGEQHGRAQPLQAGSR